MTRQIVDVAKEVIKISISIGDKNLIQNSIISKEDLRRVLEGLGWDRLTLATKTNLELVEITGFP